MKTSSKKRITNRCTEKKVLFLFLFSFQPIHVISIVWQPRFRNSRQNRQNTGARIQSFIVPFECGHIGMNGFWTFGSTFQIFFHTLIFPPVKLMNVWGTSMKSELGSKQNCFVHCFEFASEVIIAVTPFIAIFTCRPVAAAQWRMEEKRHVKVSTYGCIFGNFNYHTQSIFLAFFGLSFNACTYACKAWMQGSSHCNYKVPIRQAPGGQSRFSNQYFLSSELLLRVKEYTMWTTKRALSGYLLPLYNFHIWELFLYEFSTISNLINSCHSWPSSSVGWTDLI